MVIIVTWRISHQEFEADAGVSLNHCDVRVIKLSLENLMVTDCPLLRKEFCKGVGKREAVDVEATASIDLDQWETVAYCSTSSLDAIDGSFVQNDNSCCCHAFIIPSICPGVRNILTTSDMPFKGVNVVATNWPR